MFLFLENSCPTFLHGAIMPSFNKMQRQPHADKKLKHVVLLSANLLYFTPLYINQSK